MHSLYVHVFLSCPSLPAFAFSFGSYSCLLTATLLSTYLIHPFIATYSYMHKSGISTLLSLHVFQLI